MILFLLDVGVSLIKNSQQIWNLFFVKIYDEQQLTDFEISPSLLHFTNFHNSTEISIHPPHSEIDF